MKSKLFYFTCEFCGSGEASFTDRSKAILSLTSSFRRRRSSSSAY